MSSSSAIAENSASSMGPPQMTIHTLLMAQIKAYEIQGCLQELNSFNALGFDHTILVKVASTAVACWLLGLSEPSTLAALSHAFQDGAALRTFRQAPNAGPRKGWAAGDACMRAVQLAFLAQKGQPGAPTVLTDPKWGFCERVMGGKELLLGRPYDSRVIENVGFKLIPAEGHAISAVETAVQVARMIQEMKRVVEHDVQSVQIRTQKPAFTIINKTDPLRNAADRDHCLQYMVAVTMLKGSAVSVEDYMDESPWARNPAVDELRAKMEVLEDVKMTKDYYDLAKRSVTNAIKAFLEGGEELDEVMVECPAGHPDRVDTMELVGQKFKRLAKLTFSDDRVDEILEAVEKEDMPIHEFVDLFVVDS